MSMLTPSPNEQELVSYKKDHVEDKEPVFNSVNPINNDEKPLNIKTRKNLNSIFLDKTKSKKMKMIKTMKAI